MKQVFEVGKILGRKKYSYFVYCGNEDNITNPYVINLLKMGYVEYLKYVSENFNGFNDDDCEVYYNTETDAQTAADWANSIAVMNKLTRDKR